MAIQYILLGGTIQLSGNPIWVKLTGAVIPENATNYKLLLRITSLDDLLKGGPFVDAIAPDENGEALFDISGYIDQPFTPEFEWPAVGVITDHTAAVFHIGLECGEQYILDGELTSDYEAITYTDYSLLALKGGVPDHLVCQYSQLYHSFVNDWINAGKFLTNQPNNAVVSPAQFVKLWYLRSVELSEDARWHLDIVLSNCELSMPPGRNYTFKLSGDMVIYGYDSASPAGMLEFSINPVFAGLPDNISYGKILSYTFWLSLRDEGETEISERRTFIVNNRYYENNNYLFSANSLGGAVDVIWLHGAVEKSIETSGTEGVKQKGFTSNSRIGSILVTGKTSRRKWKINTGYKSAAEIEALADIYLSRNLWLLHDGRLIPVILTNGEKLLNDSLEDVHSADLELLEAHNSRFA